MEQLIIDSNAVISQYNTVNGQWNELGAVSGQCRLCLYKSENNEYRFVAWKKADNEVILNSFLFSTMHYTNTSPTFYQWIDVTLSIFGFKFDSSGEAKKFSDEVFSALKSIKLENSNILNAYSDDNITNKSLENELKMDDVKLATEIDIKIKAITKFDSKSLPIDSQIILKSINSEINSPSKIFENTSHPTFDILSEIISKSRIRSPKSLNQFIQAESSKIESTLSSLFYSKNQSTQSHNLLSSMINSSSGKFVFSTDLKRLKMSLVKEITSNMEKIKNEIITRILAELKYKQNIPMT